LAVLGEFTTACCFGLIGLFTPIYCWVTWPEVFLAWHYLVITIASIITAFGLAKRRPQSLKVAIVLSAYVGLPSLMLFAQIMAEVNSIASGPSTLTYRVVLALGMLGQVAVVCSCLAQLSPMLTMVQRDGSSSGNGVSASGNTDAG
jgi:hypothetical protein